MSMTISFGRVWIYKEELSSIKSSDPWIKWFCKVSQNNLAAVSLLPQGLWLLNLAKGLLTIRNVNQLSHKKL